MPSVAELAASEKRADALERAFETEKAARLAAETAAEEVKAGDVSAAADEAARLGESVADLELRLAQARDAAEDAVARVEGDQHVRRPAEADDVVREGRGADEGAEPLARPVEDLTPTSLISDL